MEELLKRMREAVENDGWLFILICGERGNGKSTLALKLLKKLFDYYNVGDWRNVLSHTIFTIHDFDNMIEKSNIRYEDRLIGLVWDDFALHTSVYQFWDPLRQRVLTEFIENFEAVREDVAVLITTAATPDMLPPKLRNAPHISLDVFKRGAARFFTKKRVLWFYIKWTGKDIIEFDPLPQEVYSTYREMKRRAVEGKRKARHLLVKNSLAEKVAAVVDLEDEYMLYGLGLKDIHGNWTPLGRKVLKIIEKNKIDFTEEEEDVAFGEKKPVTVNIAKELWSEFKKYCKANSISYSSMLNILIYNFLANLKKEDECQ